MASENVSSPAKPGKRSLFNKPAWSTPQASGDAVDLFSRSKQRYTDIVKEQEARRRKKRWTRKTGTEEEGGGDGREGKRQRVDRDSGEDSLSGTDDEEEAFKRGMAEQRKTDTIALEDSNKDTSRHLFPLKEEHTNLNRLHSSREGDAVLKERPNRTQETVPGPIEISDDEDECPRPAQDDNELIVTGSVQHEAEDPGSISDEEYPELARQARERAKSKPDTTPTASTVPVASTSPLKTLYSGVAPPGTDSTGPNHQPPPPDGKVRIFITSNIPNTNPLIVQRKLSQNLKEVRLAWCARQGFDDEMTSSVFLTWRGKRLFDVTTCKSLGIGVDEDGHIVVKGEMAAFDQQIHMEAMTEEIFEEARIARQNGSFHRSTQDDRHPEPSNPAEDSTAAVGAPPAQPKEPQIRVILKSRGYDDFKLIIKPSTKISRMQSAFRQARKVEPGLNVFLMFDGDRLNPDDTVAETEISDLDHIDVHVKKNE